MGSIPVGGARKKHLQSQVLFSTMCSTAWNVMCTVCVMFASQVMCAAAREGTHHFTSAESRYITMSEANNIIDCRKAIYITKIKDGIFVYNTYLIRSLKI